VWRLPRWQHKLIAVVITLLALSVLIGDTSTGHAFATVDRHGSTRQALLDCGSAASNSAARDSESDRFVPPPTLLAKPEPAMSSSTVAGLPPWIIFPPSPMPRIAGAVWQPPLVRSRLVASVLSIHDDWMAPGPPGSAPGWTGLSPGWPEPFSPVDRLAGVHQRFPRPPPQ
jgi:hypothetical protein